MRWYNVLAKRRRFMTSHRYRLLLLLVCALGVACWGCDRRKNKGKQTPTLVVSAAVVSDPMLLAVPDAPPAFRQTLKIEEFDRRFEEALAKLSAIGELEKTASPPFGLVIRKIEAKSQ